MDYDQAETLHMKLAQAKAVIAHLLAHGASLGSEGQRALDYFSGSAFDPHFLPWPRQSDDGIHPDKLNASNDD